MIKSINKDSVIGYSAGIITGITYGLNPLFAVPLMNDGASVNSILLIRYALSVLLLGLFLAITSQGFSVTRKQAIRLLILGAFSPQAVFACLRHTNISRQGLPRPWCFCILYWWL